MKQDSNSPRLGLKSIRNERGQSVIELILVLVVSVSLLFLAKKLFTPLSDFMNDYMGNYVACLMEYGELPPLGIQDNTLKNHQGGAGKVCEAKFKNFTLASGVQANGGGSSSSGSTGSSNSANSKNSSSNKSSGADSEKSSSGNSSSSAGTSGGGNRSNNSRSSTAAERAVTRSDSMFGTADSAFGAPASKVRVIDDEEGGDDAAKRNALLNDRNSSRVSYTNAAYRGVSGRLGEEIEKTIRKSTRVPSSKMLSVSEEGYRFKAYKKTFTPPVMKADLPAAEDEGFSFTAMLKWLIIAGIVIAIVILFGGQILNYSNSKDQ